MLKQRINKTTEYVSQPCNEKRVSTGKIETVNKKKKSELRSFKSNANIHKKEGGSYYVVSANKASSVTL